MTDRHLESDDIDDQSNGHQQAVEACQHAADALSNGDLSRGRSLLDEAARAVERAQHNDTGQAYRETAYDCYD